MDSITYTNHLGQTVSQVPGQPGDEWFCSACGASGPY